MLSKLLMPEIESLIAERKLSILKEILNDWTPADIADLIIQLTEKEQVIVFRLLPIELATDTFEHLEFETQMDLLKAMGKGEVTAILNDMSPDDRTALLEELPSSAAKQLIQLLSAEERKVARTLLGYPENSVGRLMTPDYIAVKPDWTITETLKYVRENAEDSETLNVIYVINDKGVLIDDIRIREIILASPDKKISELMDEIFVSLNVADDQELAVEQFKKYDRIALPATDQYGVLIGIVTVDDVLDVAEEEATEDIQKIAAAGVLEEPYPTIPLLQLIKKRAFWLTILFIAQILTAFVLGFFENQLGKAIALTIFIPLIISSGGNSGSQAATLVIRAMALGEISLNDWWLIMRREIISGLVLGGILGVIGFLQVSFLANFSEALQQYWVLIGLTVFFSIVGIVIWGTLSGSMLPFILKKMGADPATSSGPLVTTMVDVTGLIIYFTVAIIILKGTLL
ncbi:MAG: magnesium transporter [Ignavibacteria bacterium]|nr:magnesium transporter [Ignavibacteria bacterium]MBT8382271.1 magnesium transporter [Ignavibacteria bacterium]MBT8390944.1 magnesium transporter [Ignavibacteria bacterium]NNJ51569.1 magnesium transporter [Ignavibacteriaceae bacterium]NNL19960.1 magnesium transporter [Ignavibacteriaceae bacterium]